MSIGPDPTGPTGHFLAMVAQGSARSAPRSARKCPLDQAWRVFCGRAWSASERRYLTRAELVRILEAGDLIGGSPVGPGNSTRQIAALSGGAAAASSPAAGREERRMVHESTRICTNAHE